jgi:hypothetical protein
MGKVLHFEDVTVGSKHVTGVSVDTYFGGFSTKYRRSITSPCSRQNSNPEEGGGKALRNYACRIQEVSNVH